MALKKWLGEGYPMVRVMGEGLTDLSDVPHQQVKCVGWAQSLKEKHLALVKMFFSSTQSTILAC